MVPNSKNGVYSKISFGNKLVRWPNFVELADIQFNILWDMLGEVKAYYFILFADL